MRPEVREFEAQVVPCAFSYHDLTYNPVLLVQFNNNMLDTSGNGLHLSFDAGTTIDYGQMYPGACIVGARLNGATRLTHDTDVRLQLLGDMTIEFLAVIKSTPSDAPIVTYTAGLNDASSTFNYLYHFEFTPTYHPQWFQEYGLGINQTVVTDALVYGPNTLQHIAVTRINNRVRFYVNGVMVGNPSDVLIPPVDGSVSKLFVGGTGGFGASERFCGDMYISSLKIIGRGLTDAEVLAEFNLTMGRHPGPYWI